MGVTALDTGLRLQELLNLSRQDVDLDNLILRVKGKGNKQRLVPMSIELRKVLFAIWGSTTMRGCLRLRAARA
jgi:integrase